MWAFFGLALLVGLLVYLWAEFAFAQGSDPFDAEYQRRLARDAELRHAYWTTFDRLGRAPRASEIWEESPPDLPEDADV